MPNPIRPYTGKHQPRGHTIFSGSIQSTERYDKYYDFTCDLISAGELPITPGRPGSRMVRKAPKAPGSPWASADARADGTATFLDIWQCRTIPPAGSALDRRYSGSRPDGKNHDGAVYVGTLSGVLREHAHYATQNSPLLFGVPSRMPAKLTKPGAPDATRSFIKQELAGSSTPALIHVYSAAFVFRLVDLRLTALLPVFTKYFADPSVRKRYEISIDTPVTSLVSAINAADDYSASRGMGDAIADHRRRIGVCGLCAWSSRDESDLGLVTGAAGRPDGTIQALYGPPESEVSLLTPVGSCRSFADLVANRLLPPPKPRVV